MPVVASAAADRAHAERHPLLELEKRVGFALLREPAVLRGLPVDVAGDAGN